MKPETKIKRTVDKLGDIKAQIADLKKVEAELKAQILESDWDSIDGKLYHATVVSQEGARLDTAKVRKYVPATILLKCWKPYKSTRVMVSARLAEVA